MRRFLCFLAIVIGLVIPSPLPAGDRCCNVERFRGIQPEEGRQFDPATGLDTRQYPPDPQVDYTHIKLDLRMPDPSTRSFTCTQTITFKTLGLPVTRLRLDAVGLQIQSVTDLTGRPLEFRADDTNLIVQFANELAPQTGGGVIVEYTCTDPREGMTFALPDEAYPDRPLVVHTQGQPESNRHWFVAHDYPNDRCTSEMILTIPSQYKALSNGRLLSKESAGQGLTRWHYRIDQPHPSYLIALVLGEFEVVTGKWREVPLEYWVPPGQQEGVSRTFAKTPDMMELFSRLTGVDYPYEKYAQSVVHLFGWGGMENTSMTTLHEMTVLDERAAIDQDMEGLIAHELAHQWFGDMITCNSWPHIWLNEGFATYFESLWFEHDRGRDEYELQIWETMRSVADESGLDPRGGMVFHHYAYADEVFGRGGNSPYSKGASVLHMLRQSLGDELFFNCLREYTRQFAWRQPESDDLRKVIEALSGRSYERFFQQWVYRSGVPDVKVRYEWDDAQKLARITLEQRQEFTFQTPAFAADVEVWFVDDGGNLSRHTVPMDGRNSTGAFSFDREPRQVAVDPNGGVLMKLEYDLPMRMLIEQAQRGPTTMARLSAIAALAQRDRAGVRAVLREILFDHEAFYGLRSEVAVTLGKMQTRAARAILMDALGDERASADHKVRRACITALGEYRHPDAAQTLLRFARSDPSSAVEADASRALGKQQPDDEIIEALLENAKKRSWQHQIRSAAIRALGELGDERGIAPAMELARYGQPYRVRPAGFEALGKLGRSVEGAQRDEIRMFLADHLTDSQDRAVNAAIGALGALGDDRALDHLRRFERTTTHPWHRDTARKAIKKLEESADESAAIKSLRERIEALEQQRSAQPHANDAGDTPEPATAPALAR